MTIIYRRLGADDIEELSAIIALLVDELGESYNLVSIMTSLDFLLRNDDFKCFGAFDGRMVGAIAVMQQRKLYNAEVKEAHEMFWYVLPHYRGRVGIRLIDCIEKICESVKITFGITDSSLIKLLERRGYHLEKSIMTRGGYV